MLQDAQALFSNAQAVTATALSTNVIDARHIDNTLKDLGTGKSVYLEITCSETFVSTGSSTLVVTLESDSVSTIDTSPTVHITTVAIPKATLVSGMQPIQIQLPHEATYERYLAVRYTVGVLNFTAGKLTAAIVGEGPKFKAYANRIVYA